MHCLDLPSFAPVVGGDDDVSALPIIVVLAVATIAKGDARFGKKVVRVVEHSRTLLLCYLDAAI